MMGKIDADFKKRFKDIHKGAADIIADEARRRAPVRSGRLKRDIRTSGTTKGGVVRVGRKKLPYAGRVIFGDPITFRDLRFRQVVKYYDDELEQILDDAIKVATRGR